MTRQSLRVVLTILFASSLVAVNAQAPKPSFEVNSVKRSNPRPSGPFGRSVAPGGRFTWQYSTVGDLIQFAYDISSLQISGAPAWVSNDHFDISATAGREASSEEIRLMLQRLLEDRFRLVIRKEQREMAVNRLVLNRNDGRLGPNLVKLSDSLDCVAARAQPDHFRPKPGTLTAMTSNCGPLSLVARAAERDVGTIVVDQTGLTGEWFFRLSYVQASFLQNGSPSGLAPDPNASPLPTAIQEQLGLRLQAARGPVDVFVIESVQPPTPD